MHSACGKSSSPLGSWLTLQEALRLRSCLQGAQSCWEAAAALNANREGLAHIKKIQTVA